MKPAFRVDKNSRYWIVDVFCISSESQPLFSDWEGFEEPFSESDYEEMSKWCNMTFKVWEDPKRARRMSYTQFWFKSKKDLDWFILYWSGVDIGLD